MTAGEGIDTAGIGQTILDAVVAHYTPITGDGKLPDRRIVAAGNPRLIAWDCSQVHVALAGIGWGQAPGTGSATARQVGNPVSVGARHAVYAVQIVRRIPDAGREPIAADEATTAGLALMTDAGRLSQALAELASGRTLPRGSALAGAVEVLGPDGGFAAVEGSLTVTVGELV